MGRMPNTKKKLRSTMQTMRPRTMQTMLAAMTMMTMLMMRRRSRLRRKKREVEDADADEGSPLHKMLRHGGCRENLVVDIAVDELLPALQQDPTQGVMLQKVGGFVNTAATL